MAAIACYETQFPPEKGHHLERIRAYARQQGMAAGFAAGEVLASPGAWGTRDLMGCCSGVRGKAEGGRGKAEGAHAKPQAIAAPSTQSRGFS